MEGKVASLSGEPEEELIEEIQERERRAANVISLNVEEKRSQDNAQEIKDHDLRLAHTELRKIILNKISILKTSRIGKYSDNKIRPLIVTLNSKQEDLNILRSKHKYSETVKVFQDRTHKQRSH